MISVGLSAGIVLFGLLAALAWARAASIVVPDNLDTFISELQRAGRWNAGAAACASVAAILTAISAAGPVIAALMH